MTYFTRFPYIISLSLLNLALLCSCTQTNKNEKMTQNSILSRSSQADPSEDSLISKKLYQNKLTSWLHPYKIDIQQGNVITAEMLEQLHIGMTKPQVKLLLGTSVLSESPAKNQWLYVYHNAESGLVKGAENLILTFNQDELLSDIREEKRVN